LTAHAVCCFLHTSHADSVQCIGNQAQTVNAVLGAFTACANLKACSALVTKQKQGTYLTGLCQEHFEKCLLSTTPVSAAWCTYTNSHSSDNRSDPCTSAHLIQGTLQCEGSHGQLVGGVTDFLFISSELQQPFQAPQLLPDLHHTMPCMDVSYYFLVMFYQDLEGLIHLRYRIFPFPLGYGLWS